VKSTNMYRPADSLGISAVEYDVAETFLSLYDHCIPHINTRISTYTVPNCQLCLLYLRV